MSRWLVWIVLSLTARVAVAAPPSGYSCGDGKVLKGQGCECPSGKAPARDKENIAICVDKPRVVVEPDQPTAATACMKDRKGKYQLAVESTPPGATIYVGDKACGIVGYTPWKGLVNAGPLLVLIDKDGYSSTTRTIEGKSKQVKFTLTKVAPQIAVVIGGDKSVEGADVAIDGLGVGKAPLVKIVTVGRHLVELKKPGFPPFSQWVEVKDGQRLNITPVFKSEPPPPPASVTTGKLKVVSVVPDAQVFIDGALAGKVPLEKELEQGEHSVIVKLTGFRTAEQRIRVSAGEVVTYNAPLKAVGKLRVDTKGVQGATVFANGIRQGVAPLELELEVGASVIRVEHPGYSPWQHTFDVKGGELSMVEVVLMKK